MADRRREPVVEIQIHPGSLRWGVRYFFLTRRQLTLGIGLLVVFCGFILLNFAALPGVIASLFRHREYEVLLNERNLQGERIQAMNAELALLLDQVVPLRERTERILLTYGLTADESIGEGGFPFEDNTEMESIWSGAVSRGLRLENRVAQELGVIGSFIQEVESFETAQSIPAGETLPYRIRMPQANHTFRPGHRIMVHIQSTWFPVYDRNPQTFVPNIAWAEPEDFKRATQRIYHTGEVASYIELPLNVSSPARTHARGPKVDLSDPGE